MSSSTSPSPPNPALTRPRPRPPFGFDEHTGAPFVRIPGHADVRLTPFDLEGTDDVDCMTLWDDPLVGKWSYNRPWPYRLEHSAEFWKLVGPIWTRAMGELETYLGAHPQHPTAAGGGEGEGDTDVPFIGWPFCALRYVPDPNSDARTGAAESRPPTSDLLSPPTASDLVPPVPLPSPGPSLLAPSTPTCAPTRAPLPPLSTLGLRPGQVIGHVALFPSPQGGMSEAEMLRLPLSQQTWETAYDLLPILHGRGLGRGLLRAVEGWGRWVGLSKVCAKAQRDNPASSGLLKSCGWEMKREFGLEWPAVKGGGVRQLGWWELEL